jgi:hypothetical protein
MVGLKELRLPLGTVVLHGRAVVITINDLSLPASV